VTPPNVKNYELRVPSGAPENIVGAGLLKEIKKIKSGKIIVACFSSNVHRVQKILDAAKASGRKVAFCGRSMFSNVELARRLKLLKFQTSQVIPAKEVMKMSPEKVLVLSTGTQAEPRSSLYRMSLNNHPDIDIEEGDTVLMSSRNIPGNEKAISHMMNNLYRRGAHVIDADIANIHATGHAQQDEQKELLKWLKPKFFLPVHGEYRMLVKHFDLAREAAPKTQGLVAENGDALQLTANSFKKVGRVPFGKILLDEGATDVNETIMKDRKKMAHTGLVVVSLVVEREEGRIIEGPNFDLRGVNEDVDLGKLQDRLTAKFKQLSLEARADDMEVEEEFRRLTRRFFRDANGTKPVVIPIIYEV